MRFFIWGMSFRYIGIQLKDLSIERLRNLGIEGILSKIIALYFYLVIPQFLNPLIVDLIPSPGVSNHIDDLFFYYSTICSFPLQRWLTCIPNTNQRPPTELGVWGRPLEGAGATLCWWSLIFEKNFFISFVLNLSALMTT
jgi:hypothetical protein